MNIFRGDLSNISAKMASLHVRCDTATWQVRLWCQAGRGTLASGDGKVSKGSQTVLPFSKLNEMFFLDTLIQKTFL